MGHIHFVGFRGEEYWSAVKVWGLPDFYHIANDTRMRREIDDDDVVVFANGHEAKPTKYNTKDIIAEGV